MDSRSHIYFRGVEPPPRGGSRQVAASLSHSLMPARFEPDAVSRALNSEAERLCPEQKADAFISWILGRISLDPQSYRAVPLRRRIPACFRALRTMSINSARACLERKPELFARAANALLLGVSEFFRDKPVFEELRCRVIPGLLVSRTGLTVLSAGCSDGQELYSVAMILDQLGVLNGSFLLGVDCRGDAIRHAASGSYDNSPGTQLDPWCETYFVARGACKVIVPKLRAQIEWQTGDLMHTTEEAHWDVILFRNVAMYLDTESADALWSRLARQLNPGGIIVSGKAEHPRKELSLARVSSCIYQKNVAISSTVLCMGGTS